MTVFFLFVTFVRQCWSNENDNQFYLHFNQWIYTFINLIYICIQLIELLVLMASISKLNPKHERFFQ